MAEEFELLLQLFLFALLQAPLVELAQLEADILLVALVSRKLIAQGIEACCRVAIMAVSLGVLLTDAFVLAQCVEHAELEALGIEQQVLML